MHDHINACDTLSFPGLDTVAMRHKPFTAYETSDVDMSSIAEVVNLSPKVRCCCRP